MRGGERARLGLPPLVWEVCGDALVGAGAPPAAGAAAAAGAGFGEGAFATAAGVYQAIRSCQEKMEAFLQYEERVISIRGGKIK